MAAIGARGKDLHIANIAASTTGHDKTYTTSTDVFNDFLATLPDGTNYCSKFAGAGISVSTTGVLAAENNAWSILINATDDDSGALPLLITRNVDSDALNRALRTGISSNDFSTHVKLGIIHKTPLGKKGFVIIRRDGRIARVIGKYCTLGTIFDHTEIPPRPKSAPPPCLSATVKRALHISRVRPKLNLFHN
jgi:hypothetical protein